VDLALANAEQAMARELAGEKSREATLAGLAERLHLPAPPRHIECFDISTFQGAATVGVMVCFRDAEPSRSDYRKFVVRNATQQPDDFAAMREVLERRYRRVLEEGGALPDLILIDGGKGQLRQAIEIGGELGLHEVALAAIAKSRLKTPADAPSDVRVRSQERIFLPGRANPVTFRPNAAELFLLQRVRDEAHRFAITFHRARRSKRTLGSALEDIPGIGPKRRTALLREFGSVSALRGATVAELRERGGLSAAMAEAVRAHLDALGKEGAAEGGKSPRGAMDTPAQD
jgi:excinuclease ABC subunit C